MTDVGRSDSDADMVIACPECDSGQIKRRTSEQSVTNWKCGICRAEFDEPVERERRATGTVSGLAGRLLDADPNEVVSGD